ncbi:MAG TPA: amidohydrolase family protein [Bacteroidales bacterium]|nr:amidohydrolase family protein [Bacteroidales bacterium]
MIKRLFFTVIILLTLTGCRKSYYTVDDFISVPKIDAHVHIDTDKGYFEKQAQKDNFRLITLNVDHSNSAAVEQQLGWALHAVAEFPGNVFYGATFCFDTAGWGTPAWSNRVVAQLERSIKKGAVTVKIWKNIGMTERDRNGRFIMVDDPGLDPVFDFIISKGLPVTGHLGEPRNCWLPLAEMTVKGDSSYYAGNPKYHMYLHPEYPSYEDQIRARDNMLERHPGLIFIGCHLGSLEWNVDSLAVRLDRFPNMSVDMAARVCHLEYQSAKDREKVRNFCIKYQDRLLYGTDLSSGNNNDPVSQAAYYHRTWLDDWKYFATDEMMNTDAFSGEFKGLQLPREVVDKIFYRNAVKWYNLP